MAKLVKKVRIFGELSEDPVFAASNGKGAEAQFFEATAYFNGGFYKGNCKINGEDYYLLGQEREVGGFLFSLFNKKGNDRWAMFSKDKGDLNFRLFENCLDKKTYTYTEYLIGVSNAQLEVSDVETSELKDTTMKNLAFSPRYEKKFNNYFERSIGTLCYKEFLNELYDMLADDSLTEMYKRIDREHPIDMIPLSKVLDEKIVGEFIKKHNYKENPSSIISKKEDDEMFDKIASEVASLDIDFSQISFDRFVQTLHAVVKEAIPCGGSVALHFAKKMYDTPYLQKYISETPEEIFASEILNVGGHKYRYVLNKIADAVENYAKGKFSNEDFVKDIALEFNYDELEEIVLILNVILFVSLDEDYKKMIRSVMPKIEQECEKQIETKELLIDGYYNEIV